MKTLIDHLAQYAAYHRDPRNIHTHFVGVPMIMFAVVVMGFIAFGLLWNLFRLFRHAPQSEDETEGVKNEIAQRENSNI